MLGRKLALAWVLAVALAAVVFTGCAASETATSRPRPTSVSLDSAVRTIQQANTEFERLFEQATGMTIEEAGERAARRYLEATGLTLDELKLMLRLSSSKPPVGRSMKRGWNWTRNLSSSPATPSKR